MQKALIVAALLLGNAGIISNQPNKDFGGEQQPAPRQQPVQIAASSLNKQSNGSPDQLKSRSGSPTENVSIEGNKGLSDPNWCLVIVGIATAFVIGWQSNETRKSAKAALLQIQMMKDKERARVEIKAFGLELTRVTEEFWYIAATIELRNVGAGRAYVRLGTGDLEVIGDGIAREPYQKTLDIVDGFIDPTGEPAKESFYFFQPDGAALSKYSHGICDGKIGLSIKGFIEYETVGTRYHRNFNYGYVGYGNPLNIGARLTFSDEFAPKTDEEKISFGFWSPSSFWTGGNGENDEYEMEPQKNSACR